MIAAIILRNFYKQPTPGQNLNDLSYVIIKVRLPISLQAEIKNILLRRTITKETN